MAPVPPFCPAPPSLPSSSVPPPVSPAPPSSPSEPPPVLSFDTFQTALPVPSSSSKVISPVISRRPPFFFTSAVMEPMPVVFSSGSKTSLPPE